MTRDQLTNNVRVVFISGLTKRINLEFAGFQQHLLKLERDFRSLNDGKLFGYMYYDQYSHRFELNILDPESRVYENISVSTFDMLIPYIYRLIIIGCDHKYDVSHIYDYTTKYMIIPISDFTSVNENSWTSIIGKSSSTNEFRSVIMMPKKVDIRYFIEILLNDIFKVFKPFYENTGDPSTDYNMEIVNSYGEKTRHIIVHNDIEVCRQIYGYLRYRLLANFANIDIIVGYLDTSNLGSSDKLNQNIYLESINDQGIDKGIDLSICDDGTHVMSRYSDEFNQKMTVLHVISPSKLFNDIAMPMASYWSTSIHDMISYINLQRELKG